jgi:hypothetical protein
MPTPTKKHWAFGTENGKEYATFFSTNTERNEWIAKAPDSRGVGGKDCRIAQAKMTKNTPYTGGNGIPVKFNQ